MSSLENGEDRSANSAQTSSARTSKPGSTRRRKLSLDDELKIARLYAETRTPTAEIREQFGIGESSLYRVMQRHGVALRGRTGPTSSPSSPASTRKSAPASTRKSAPATARRRGPASTRTSAPASTQTAAPASRGTDGATSQRFRIRFEAESVFEAIDVRDALRQAESLGATEITAVARVN